MKTLKPNSILAILLIFIAIGCVKPSSQFFNIPSKVMLEFDQELFLRAMDHHKKGQIESAVGLWKKFLLKYPNSFEARNNLSLLYYANDEITKAIYQLDLALKLEPSSERIKNNLLRALKIQVAIHDENKEYDSAIKDFKLIAKLSPVIAQEKIERQIDALEDKIFEQVKKSNLMDEYLEFLKKYPRSHKNSDEARLWVEKTKQLRF
jgi:tetratricopeptide (TPR) repeat protein